MAGGDHRGWRCRPGRRHLPRGTRVAALAVLLLGACGGADGPPVEESGLRLSGHFAAPPEGPFWAPIDLAAAGDHVWVLDAGAARVFGYRTDGEHRITIGRKGHGPGELDQPLALGLRGDTLWVLDPGNRRIQFFATSGRPLGSEPLPDSLPPPVDLVRAGGTWIASTPFSPGPLLRFDLATGESRAFGGELERRARELGRGRGEIPGAYRLEVVDDRLWAFHLYLPLAGVYDLDGRPLRLVEYPGPDVEAGQSTEEELGAGRIRRKVAAPAAPAGGLGVLRRGSARYLLTHQRAGDRQRMYRLEGLAVSDRAALAPGRGLFLTSVESGDRTFAVGTIEESGEPGVHVLE